MRGYPQGDQQTVSRDGGRGPVWSANGDELFFQGSDGEGARSLMAVSVIDESATLSLGTPTKLFDSRMAGPTGTIEGYDESTNGRS